MPGRSGDPPSADGGTPGANRILALCLLAFATALAAHALLGLAGAGRDEPLRLFVTPLIGAVIVYFGLTGYPTAGRWRLSIMVGVGLLFIAGAV